MSDTLGFIVGVVGLVIGFICLKNYQLPIAVRLWLRRIGIANVEAFIKDAIAYYSDDTPGEVKRDYVVQHLKNFVKTNFNFDLPTSYANLIVEYVYQKIKAAEKQIPWLQKILDYLNDLLLILSFK